MVHWLVAGAAVWLLTWRAGLGLFLLDAATSAGLPASRKSHKTHEDEP